MIGPSFWEERSERERVVLLAGALVSTLLLGYWFVHEPLQAALQSRRSALTEDRVLLEWMRSAEQRLERARALEATDPTRGARTREGDESLPSVIARSAGDAGLADALREVVPEERGRLRVELEAVPFDRMIQWLALLAERDRIDVRDARIERVTERLADQVSGDGQVDAHLVLQR